MSTNKNHNPQWMYEGWFPSAEFYKAVQSFFMKEFVQISIRGTEKLVWFGHLEALPISANSQAHWLACRVYLWGTYSSASATETSVLGLYMVYSEHKPLWFFGWDRVGGMACQAIKMACKPIGRAWAGDHTQIHAPARNKPFRAGASHSAKPKMSLS
ncbi:hypothetical protein B0H11DRAFT_2210219 [Mycena galericulata]|nr:hypothetical protein B0H11DRAFT_2210219 [Mycena galericulata]